MTALTGRLAAFASGLAYDDIPAPVVAHLKVLLLDLAGIMVRAGRELASTERLTAGLAAAGLAEGRVRSFAVPDRGFAAPAAALVDAMAAHSLDFDDTHAAASTHPGAPSVAAALAAAQVAGADGRRLIAGIVAGYEVHLRLSLALVPREHYARGHALTSTCGTFAAAAAAGRVLGLSPQQMEQAFGVALNQTSGSLQFLEGGTWGKRFQVGYAAFNGTLAALLASAGMQGVQRPIEGRHGFLHNYSGAPQPERVLEGLGERFETLGTGVKPYPVCRYAHAAIDAVVALRARYGLAAQAVERIEVGLGRVGLDLLGHPKAEKQSPRSVVDGQFSMPYCAAVALQEGGIDWDSLQEHLGRQDTLALCSRVETLVDPRVEALAPRHMSGSVAIVSGGRRHEALVEVPLGEPENFPSLAGMRSKFRGLVAPFLDEDAQAALAAAFATLESMTDPIGLHKLADSRPVAPGGRGAESHG